VCATLPALDFLYLFCFLGLSSSVDFLEEMRAVRIGERKKRKRKKERK
jgi:hypothetical protein